MVKKTSKKLEKPLDKPHTMWYNTSVPKERNKKMGGDLTARKGVVVYEEDEYGC